MVQIFISARLSQITHINTTIPYLFIILDYHEWTVKVLSKNIDLKVMYWPFIVTEMRLVQRALHKITNILRGFLLD